MRRIPSIIWVFLLLFALVNCAKRGSPTGGPEDETPPQLVGAEPALYATGFNDKRIRIQFDEYVKLKELQKQLIVSPPLDQGAYTVTPQGGASKHIDIKILDTLQENTTYTFNFGQSIVDNNEDNPYEYFKYVFSTGDYIDSLSVRGLIKDGLNKFPDQFISVMLYKVDSTYTDSIIYKQKPTYLTNTLDSLTSFDISNVAEGKYLLVAIKDEGSNYTFDQDQDKIGFKKQFIDVPSDSLYELVMFKENIDFKFGRPSHGARNKITFGYLGDPSGMEVELLTPQPEGFRSVLLKDPEKDSLNYWFTPFEADSLQFKVRKGDEAEDYTVKLRKLAPDSLSISPSSTNASIHEKLFLLANTPLTTTDQSKMSLIDNDSVSIDFETALDQKKNHVDIRFEPKPGKRYQLKLFPNAVKDMYGETNDTLSFVFSAKELSELGNLQLELSNVNFYPIIIQITDQEGEVIREQYAKEEKPRYFFDGMKPGKYFIRVIDDANENGKWDTGRFLEKTQPEIVRYHPTLIDLRANWELNEQFKLKD